MSRMAGCRLVKYSDLAVNVTGRLSMNGRKTESRMDRWLEARMAPPVCGTYSAPVTSGRHSPRRNGPATSRESWYCTLCPPDNPVPAIRSGPRWMSR